MFSLYKKVRAHLNSHQSNAKRFFNRQHRYYFLESPKIVVFPPKFSVTRVNSKHFLPLLDLPSFLGVCLKIWVCNSMNFNGLSGKQGREQMQNRKMPEEVVFLVALWTVIPCLTLLFVILGLSYFRVSLQIQVAAAVIGVVIISIRTVSLYRGVRARVLVKIRTGPEVLVGSIGTAATDLKPKGEVRVNGEFWQATAKEGWIEKNREVEVVGVDGLVLTVETVKEKTA